jgi:hypothetical protein
MKKALRAVLWVLTGLITLNFLVMGLRWAVAPSGAAEALNMPLFNGAALSSQIGDVGALFLCMGLFVLFGLVTKKREWFFATSLLVYAIAIFRILAWLFHGASLVMPLIVPEIVIGTLLLIASKKLTADQLQKPQ